MKVQGMEPRWRKRLRQELQYHGEMLGLDRMGWGKLLETRKVTSTNYDTVIALDWPHFCTGATVGCGGIDGWCYTFQGYQATKQHNRHVAMVDLLARKDPELFSQIVVTEVQESVRKGIIPYPNLRYSGSGEITSDHLPALQYVSKRGVHLWGFTRTIAIATQLRKIGAAVIVSCDRTSPILFIDEARADGFSLAYTSSGVQDLAPLGTIVTFPIHREGKVNEVVDSDSLCPKVVADYLDDFRPRATCQKYCRRCHQLNNEIR